MNEGDPKYERLIAPTPEQKEAMRDQRRQEKQVFDQFCLDLGKEVAERTSTGESLTIGSSKEAAELVRQQRDRQKRAYQKWLKDMLMRL